MKVIVLFYYLIVQTTIICAFNQYLGCFIDQVGSRDLEVFIDDYEQLTPKQCILACREQNFLYAAIQYGNECRCGQKYGKYGQTSNDECIYLCSTSEKCGGDNRNSVYSVVNSKYSINTDITCQNNLIGYQGCFDDVTLQIVMNEVNSIEECVKRCSGNYNYAGVKNGNLCYCGNDLNQASSSSNLCNVRCQINSNDMTIVCCGGLRVLSVYNVKNYQSPLSIDLSETYIRVKRADAGNDTTFMSTGASTVITSTSSYSITGAANTLQSSMTTSSIPISSNAFTTTMSTLLTSLMTSAQLLTTGLLSTSLPSSTSPSMTLSTSAGTSSSIHTDTSQGTSMVTSSSSHTDTSQGTSMVTGSSSHTDTSQATSMVTGSSSHTDTSQATSMTTGSSSHTDTSQVTSMVTGSSPHTDTTSPTSSILLSSSVMSNTVSATLTSILTGTGQSLTSSYITGSSLHSDSQSPSSITAGTSASTGTSLTSTLISLLTSPQTVSTTFTPFTSTYVSQTLTVPISSTLISSSNSVTPSISSTFSTLMTTGSYNPSSILSTLSSQFTSTVTQQSSMGLSITSSNAPSTQSASSITSTSSLSTNLFASSSTSVGAQSTVTTNTSPSTTANPTTVSMQSSVTATVPITSTNISPITTTNSASQTSVISNTINGSITSNTITTTTAPLPVYVISTVLITSTNQTLDPTNANTRESIRQKLIQIMTLAFFCVSNPSNINCTAGRQRVKRQACSLGYNVILVSDITAVPNTNPQEYTVSYIVTNPCNSGAPILPIQVKAATDSLSRSIITNLLGYGYDGEFIRSTNIITSTDAPTTDRKLWLIGAVLGPVAFVLLLIFLFCYLHFKCRPRPTNRRLVETVYNAPQLAAKAANYQTVPNETVREKATSEKNLHILTQINPLVGGTNTSSEHLTPIALQKSSNNPPQYPISNDIPLEEIRRQNVVERWRNKLRLQEKFHQPSIGLQDLSAPSTNRSIPSQYDNRAFEQDPSRINIQPIDDRISVHSARRMPPTTEIETGRSKLHRLLDDVLDKAESEESYNPDSDIERQRRRRQRRRAHSISDDHQNSPIISNRPQIPHTPVIPQVSERPDPSIIRLRYNPYEAGDHAHDIARFTPVELRTKYATDDNEIGQRSTQFSSRSNPPLFYDDSTIADRAATATNAYATPKRLGQTRLETDREAMMRHDGGRVDRRQHKFNDDAVYIDTIPKNRDGDRMQARTAWADPPIHNDVLRPNNYRDEYLIAKQSVLNTRNIISSIHDELHNISFPPSDSYHA